MEVVLVAEDAVGNDGLAAGLGALFGHERPLVRFGGLGQQVLKSGAQGGLMLDVVSRVVLERGVIGLNGLMRWLDESGVGHGGRTSARGNWGALPL